jgi:hypothetical protein
MPHRLSRRQMSPWVWSEVISAKYESLEIKMSVGCDLFGKTAEI